MAHHSALCTVWMQTCFAILFLQLILVAGVDPERGGGGFHGKGEGVGGVCAPPAQSA